MSDDYIFKLMEQHHGEVLAVTGHRPDKLGGFDNPRPHNLVRAHMMACMMAMQPSQFISGMALGIDTWAAESALVLGIPLIAAVPFEGQASMWPKESRARYDYLLKRAAEVHVVCPGPYYPSKMQARNEWMVDRCGLLLAYWDGSLGGTANCVHYANKVCRTVARPDLAALLRGP